jgi:hypothetical protein
MSSTRASKQRWLRSSGRGTFSGSASSFRSSNDFGKAGDPAMTQTAEHYLSDLGALVKEQALAAKRGKDAAAGSGSFDYALGRLTAWHEVVSLMQQQALAFGLDLAELSLEDISPERDLT